MNKDNLKGIECKFVHHIPYLHEVRPDTHLVKEYIHYTDGKIEKNLKIMTDFKRPFWITKEHYRNHQQKKESEELKKLTEYQATQSNLPREICKRLGKIVKNPTMRDVSSSPYLYGVDVDSRVFIKKWYMDTYGDLFTPYSLCVLDVEVDIDTGELVILTVATEKEAFVAILSKLTRIYPKPKEQLEYLYKKYIPETELSQNVKIEYGIFNAEVELIEEAFKRVHKWSPDFLTIWNLSYDVGVMLNVIQKAGKDPKDIFSDPSLPENLRYFKYVEDNNSKVTASGVNKPPGPHERWHKVTSACGFYWIDAMCAYNYVRVGGKAVAGGYSLDNVLTKELGSSLKKLKFEGEGVILQGPDWHRYMVKDKPLEYIIYNIWDVLSVLELDKKTKDLETSVPVLSGYSSYDNFKSGPKKIVDNMHFFYYDRDKVLGCRSQIDNDESEIDLSEWIVMLYSHRVKDNGFRSLLESDSITTNTKLGVFDADAVSSYPSNSIAINISRDTMSKEILEYKDIDPMTAKLQNINLMFGPINSVEYCTKMFNFPKLHQLAGAFQDQEIIEIDNLRNSSGEDDIEEEDNDDDE